MIINDLLFALHNLRITKWRSIYTSFISFLLMSLIIFLSIIGISIKVNGDNLAERRYKDNNVINITMMADSYVSDTSFVTLNDYNDIKNYIDSFSDSNISISISLNFKKELSLNAADIDKEIQNGNYKTKNGNYPTKDKYLYVGENYANANNLDCGDKIKLAYDYDDINYEKEFIIADILYTNHNILFDDIILEDNDNFFKNMNISLISITINDISNVKEATRINKDIINYLSSFKNVIVECVPYKEYERTNMFTNLFFYSTLIFNILVSLLSISLIVNSISVMLDLNKKTLGLYKILGIKKKDTILIIIFEILLSSVIGIILSIILIYSLLNPIQFVFDKIWNILYPFIDINYFNNFETTLIYSALIPIGIIITMLLLLFTFSFRRIKKVTIDEPINQIKRIE